ncbi:CHASE2 domain-containing protein [Acaryochloris sp. CCMEE 5410]|uniref:CHASE2 domain-containing protein n=1 Tax=Acaryochloris sp. CCMEE 5410 TaxID=310037 RepID=UPI001585A527|nr:CHASE2 domain-containing protein [Acaryochloris sp. CCMEE 5410]KAI9129206.1 CHASE2 domain-containing protein [Acaryochloris sp. CCMEE 5410]
MTIQLDGDLPLQGFHCMLAIGREAERPQAELQGALPPSPKLEQCLLKWKKSYQLLEHVARIEPQQIIYVGAKNIVEECRNTAKNLAKAFTQWLTAESFRNIDQLIREILNREDQVRILIRTSDPQLHQLPWHLWDVVDCYPKTEVAIAAVSFRQQLPPHFPLKSQRKVRILAIVGHSIGIDTHADRLILNTLPNGEVTLLLEPQRKDLNEHLWQQPWDVLFFAGHSQTKAHEGQISINSTDTLPLSELQYGLRQAINHGLQLAIFNSCDGLGLAYSLEELQIPQMIVMREPVPDQVAHAFLKYFLYAYAQGASLYLATRQARERLQGLEKDFPCASWLPIIFQHPAAVPPQWQQLLDKKVSNIQPSIEVERTNPPIKRFGSVIALSTLITGLTLGVRWLGGLTTTELWAYDTLLQLRPPEPQDERLLIITIDDADIHYQEREGMQLSNSLSPQAWTLLTEKLNLLQPHSVGLDIYRSTPLNTKVQSGIKASKWPLFAICKVPSVDDGDPSGVDPPPNIPPDYVGFSDITIDPDDVLRRHLIAMKNPSFDSRCTARNAFSLLMALHYLETKAKVLYELTPAKEFKFGDVTFSRLTPNAGGYQNLDAAGYQILLNYRSLRSPQDIAPTLRLRDLIQNKIPKQRLEQLQGRIILVGVTALTSRDDWLTPFSRSQTTAKRKLSGVVVQAQMISQILSAVQDQRPLLWWMPEWGEAIWIWGWAFIGALVAAVEMRPIRLAGVAILAFTLLMGLCYLFILQAGWLPLIPTLIAMISSLIVVSKWRRIRATAIQHSE